MRIESGVGWMVVAALLFALMGACVKAATFTNTASQAIFFRAAAGFPFLLWWARRRRIPLWGTRQRGLLVLRGILGFIALSLYFHSISQIPIGNASILNATSPVFVVLLSGFLLKERASRGVLASLPFFLLGVVLIVKPEAGAALLPSLEGLASGVFGALAYMSIRRLGETEHATTVVFYFTLLSFAGSIPMVILNWAPLTLHSTVYLVLAGLLATGGQMAMTRAYHMEKAGFVSLFSYTGPVFAFLLGMFFFREIPDVYAVVGAALVLGSALFLVRHQALKNEKDVLFALPEPADEVR
ncbi:MAG: DMT family transporter [Pseudomonadota bacterium]